MFIQMDMLILSFDAYDGEKEVPNMRKTLDLHAYWALLCIKIALVREKTLLTLIQSYDTTKKTQKTQPCWWHRKAS